MKCALILFVALIVALAAAEDVEKGKVITLTDANYDTLTATGIWLVKYYAPWCGHCKKLAPTWEELAKVVNGEFNVAELDCTANTAVAQKMGIRGYPTIKLLEPGREPVDARVPRTVNSFIDFVVNSAQTADLKGKIAKQPEPAPADEKAAKQAPPPPPKKQLEDEPAPADSDVIVLTDANIDAETAKGPMLVKFYAPWCGHCKHLAPTWEELAHKSKGEAFRVAKVNAEAQRSLATKFGIRGFPTVFFVAPGLEKPAEYQGERTVDAFTQFAKDQLAKLDVDNKPHSEL